MNPFYNRHFLRLFDFTLEELKKILSLSVVLKKNKKNKKERKYLKDKNIALIFEKESTRTRCAFEVAAYDQGASVSYLGPGSIHLGKKESIEDTAHVLSRMYDGIQYRGHDHSTLKKLSQYSIVPVWNGLTRKFHPTQILADLLTMQEYCPEKSFSKVKCAYVGDANNNISNSLLEAASIFGLDFRLIAPKQFWPKKNFLLSCQKKMQINKGNLTCTENIEKGVKNVDFIYTDVWVSMGEKEEEWEKKIQLLTAYQVNDKMLNFTENSKIKVLHCLPALHDDKTKIGKFISKQYGLCNGIEISDNVFKKNQKIIFSQAENRLHTIKAILVSSLSKDICV